MTSRSCLVLMLIAASLCIHTGQAQDSRPEGEAENLPIGVDADSETVGEQVEAEQSQEDLNAAAPDGAEAESSDVVVEQPIVREYSCYQCNSFYDGSSCESSEPSVLAPFLKACPPNTERCRKAEQNIQGEKRLIRSCATIGSAQRGVDQCYERSGSVKILTQTCECFNPPDNLKKACNTATLNAMTSALSYITVIVASLFLAAWR